MGLGKAIHPEPEPTDNYWTTDELAKPYVPNIETNERRPSDGSSLPTLTNVPSGKTRTAYETHVLARLNPPTGFHLSHYHDKPAFVIFFLGVCAFIALAVYVQAFLSKPNRFVCARDSNKTSIDSGTCAPQLDKHNKPIETLYYQLKEIKAIEIYAKVQAAAMGLSLIFFAITQRFPTYVILLAHICGQLFFWGVAIYCFTYKSWGWGVLWFVLAFFQLIYLVLSQRGFRHASILMKVAVQLITRHPGLIMLSILASILQSGWFLLWGWMYVTLAERMGATVSIALFFSLIWFSQVLKYVMFTIQAGVAATWYFNKSIPNPILRSARRTLTTSIGSVCFGAMFVSISKALATLSGYLRNMRGKGAIRVFAIASIVLDGIFRLFNIYGFCHVAIYGTPYFKACTHSMCLLKNSGIEMIMIDGIINGAIILGCIFVGMISAGFSWLIAVTTISDQFSYNLLTLVYVPCFLLGLLGGLSILDMVESIVATIYVCFAEEPQALETTDKVLYMQLLDTWKEAQEAELADTSEEGSDNDSDEDIVREHRDTDSDDDKGTKIAPNNDGKSSTTTRSTQGSVEVPQKASQADELV